MGLTAYRYCLFMLLVGCMLVALSPVVSSPAFAQKAETESQADGVVGGNDTDTSSDLEPLDPDKPLAELPDFGVEWPELDAPTPGSPAPEEPAVDTARDVEMDRRLAEEEISEIEDQDIRTEAEAELEQGIAASFQPGDSLAERRYELEFTGLPVTLSTMFNQRFQALSALEEYRGDEANFAQIKRRAETDRELVERLLRIEGYYDAIVRNSFAAGRGTDIDVTIAVTAGPQYQLDAITLNGLQQAGGSDAEKFRNAFGLQSDDIINSDRIMEARARLDEEMAENGYAFAETAEPELTVDHAERDAYTIRRP